jgi:hypothetical protein
MTDPVTLSPGTQAVAEAYPAYGIALSSRVAIVNDLLTTHGFDPERHFVVHWIDQPDGDKPGREMMGIIPNEDGPLIRDAGRLLFDRISRFPSFAVPTNVDVFAIQSVWKRIEGSQGKL